MLRKGTVPICPLELPPSGEALNGDVYVLWRTADTAPAVTEFRKLLLEWAALHPTV
jgi:hypothetical protein